MKDTVEKIKSFLEEQYNFSPQNIKKIEQGVMNSNFRFESDDCPYLFKIYNFKTLEEISFEIAVLEHLKQNDFPSPNIIKNKSGELAPQFLDRPSLVYEYMDGAPLDEVTVDIMRQIGALKGRMHAVLSDFSPPIEKPRWDHKDIQALIEKEGYRLVDAQFPNARGLLSFLAEELKKIRISEHELPRGVTHQDVKPENVIMKDGSVVGFVDFDNSYHGVLLYDIATTAIWTCFSDGVLNNDLLIALVSGYEEKRPLADIEKENMYRAIKFRLLREAFIGPFVTLHDISTSKERSDHFLTLYKNFTYE